MIDEFCEGIAAGHDEDVEVGEQASDGSPDERAPPEFLGKPGLPDRGAEQSLSDSIHNSPERLLLGWVRVVGDRLAERAPVHTRKHRAGAQEPETRGKNGNFSSPPVALQVFGQSLGRIRVFHESLGSGEGEATAQGQTSAYEHRENAELVKTQGPDRCIAPNAQVLASQRREFDRVGENEGQNQRHRGQHAPPMPGDLAVLDPAYPGCGKAHEKGHVQGRGRPVGKFCVHGVSIAPATRGLR